MQKSNNGNGRPRRKDDGVLDMSKASDRVMLTRAANERWAIPEERRILYTEKLHEVLKSATKAREINSCLRTIMAMERLNLDYKAHERVEGGLATDIREYRLKIDSPSGLDFADPVREAEGRDLCR